MPGQADVGIGPYNRPRKRNIFPFYAVGVDAYIDPPETPVLWWFSGESVLIPIVHRRGGRPCPPAENARFCGDPMRIRNILMGRCRHRPLQPTSQTQHFPILRRRGGRPCPPAENARFCGDPMRIRNILMGRCRHRPLQPTSQTQHFPILRRRGRCLHRPTRNARFMAVFRRNRVDFPFYVVGGGRPCPPAEALFLLGGKRRTHVTGTFS